LLVIAGLGLFGLFACCGGLLFMMPKPNWHEHKSEKGGYTVQFPGKVQPDVEQAAGLRLEEGEKSEGAVASWSEQYIVIYKDGPGTKERAAKNETDEQEIDVAIDKLLTSAGAGKPDPDKRMTVGGFPARQVTFHCDSGWYTVRMIVADTRVYSLIVHSLSHPVDTNVSKFMDSFQITDEKLVKKGKEREAEAAKAAVKAKELEVKRHAEAEEEQKQRVEADRKRRVQESTEPTAEGRELRRAARRVTELALTVANEP
jgi:hypothetical protein